MLTSDISSLETDLPRQPKLTPNPGVVLVTITREQDVVSLQCTCCRCAGRPELLQVVCREAMSSQSLSNLTILSTEQHRATCQWRF